MNATKGDALIERGADGLQRLSEKAARRGGVTAKLAQPLAEDAVFLRKLKPSLIQARIKGDAPTGEKPPRVEAPPVTPTTSANGGGGPNPFAVIGAAAGAGLALAKVIDWRGHAHPRP